MTGVVELAEAPRLGPLYRRAALGTLHRRRPARQVPDTTLVLRAVTVDRDQLAGYARVCGYRLSDELPPTYPHVLAFPLAMTVLTGADFPFPVIGLVHLANRIEVRRPVGADERLELTVRPADLRDHERGRCVDIRTTASVGDEVVCRSVSTYLHKEARPDTRAPGPREPAEAPTGGALWRVGREVGPAYARVSGDRNPIHTSRLAARAFGYPGPIAHGMWSLARCLAGLEGRLPRAYTVEVTFRRPIVLPARVRFTSTPGVESWTIGLHNARTGAPHLTGSVTVLA